MNQPKTVPWAGRGEPVADPAFIRQTLQDLLLQEVEFPIKVEGAQTLPYAAQVQHIDLQKGLLHLKLIRTLPHELAVDAAFSMVFSAGDQRFEAPCTFKGREGYLLYRFTIPLLMAVCDRRHHKRFPFRPREKAYVVAQDASVPGHGVSGPLVNLSQGGLAFRVDRVMRLDDHLRVTPGLGFFERGKSFPMLKIRDLPNLPVFDARGVVAFAEERGGEIILGLQFGELKEAELRDIQLVLTIRDQVQRSPAGSSSEGPREPGSRRPATAQGPVEDRGPATRVAPAGTRTPDALLRLGRRCTRLLLAMPPGPEREQVHQALRGGGFLRLETTDTLDLALANLRADRNLSSALLVIEQQGEGEARLGSIRAFQKEFSETRECPVALLSREEGLPPSVDPLIRTLPWPVVGDLSWLSQLDDLAGLG